MENTTSTIVCCYSRPVVVKEPETKPVEAVANLPKRPAEPEVISKRQEESKRVPRDLMTKNEI